MKNILIVILSFILTVTVFAENDGAKNPEQTPAETVSITGQVTDFISGEALTGVEVTIEGTDIKTYTDFDGNFKVDNLKAGKYNIIASYISYKKSLVENYDVKEKACDVDIKLQAD
ncbi:MAG: carboxypeptidase-like regulatory domain-containing protein [Bacteroidales bacterium]|nr:carboxypeptidase-like regulatory domain-containing protein [Bacteroidales bacterium]